MSSEAYTDCIYIVILKIKNPEKLVKFQSKISKKNRTVSNIEYTSSCEGKNKRYFQPPNHRHSKSSYSHSFIGSVNYLQNYSFQNLRPS